MLADPSLPRFTTLDGSLWRWLVSARPTLLEELVACNDDQQRTVLLCSALSAAANDARAQVNGASILLQEFKAKSVLQKSLLQSIDESMVIRSDAPKSTSDRAMLSDASPRRPRF